MCFGCVLLVQPNMTVNQFHEEKQLFVEVALQYGGRWLCYFPSTDIAKHHCLHMKTASACVAKRQGMHYTREDMLEHQVGESEVPFLMDILNYPNTCWITSNTPDQLS